MQEGNRSSDSSQAHVGSLDPVVTFEEVDTDLIPTTDIVFECPYCGKSLSIDQRGAGLVIECTACHQLVTVPIPEGMDITDLDLPPEEQEAQLSNMRVLLSQSQERIATLTAENQDLLNKVMALEKAEAFQKAREGGVASVLSSMVKNQEEMSELLKRLRRIFEEP